MYFCVHLYVVCHLWIYKESNSYFTVAGVFIISFKFKFKLILSDKVQMNLSLYDLVIEPDSYTIHLIKTTDALSYYRVRGLFFSGSCFCDECTMKAQTALNLTHLVMINCNC